MGQLAAPGLKNKLTAAFSLAVRRVREYPQPRPVVGRVELFHVPVVERLGKRRQAVALDSGQKVPQKSREKVFRERGRASLASFGFFANAERLP